MRFLQKFLQFEPEVGGCSCTAADIKKPKWLTHLGFVDFREPPRNLIWWSRRESNPRPQAFVRQIYMLSWLIWI